MKPGEKWSSLSFTPIKNTVSVEIHPKKRSTVKTCTRQLVPTLFQKTSQPKHSCLAWKTLRATNLACSSTLRALHAHRGRGGPCRKHGGVFLQRFPWCLFQNVSCIINLKGVYHASSRKKTDFLWKETYLVGRNRCSQIKGVWLVNNAESQE